MTQRSTQPTLKVRAGDAESELSPDQRCVIGRSSTADIVIDDDRVSRHHLVLEPGDGGWSAQDVSSNGTWLNGKRVQTVEVHGEVRIRLGSPQGPEVVLTGAPMDDLDIRTMLPGDLGLRPPPARDPDPRGRSDATPRGTISELAEHELRTRHQLQPGATSIGRGPNNDIVLRDLLASRRHVDIHLRAAEMEIIDLGSANGTFVNGHRVTRTVLERGDIVAIGHHLFEVDEASLFEFVDRGNVSFEAQGLSVWAGEKQLMHDISFRLPARTLLAIVGPSGAGKSTLLGALTGFRPANAGFVHYAGRDLYSDYDELRHRIGYVPQEDLLHTALTVRQALEYGAELRLPPDVTAEERTSRVDEVMAELGLTAHADTTVSRLSGGQRKRTSVALELLTKPSLLYLDEPTSGLDPGLDKSVMQSLRTLADDGRTVITVTHNVAQLGVCDLVLVLAPGGYVAYFGPPGRALRFFEMSDFPDVFLALERAPGEEWLSRFRASDLYVTGSMSAPSARSSPTELPTIRQQPVRRQLATLCRRQLSVVRSDTSYLRLIIAFPILLGLIPRVIPASHGLSIIPNQPNRDASTVLIVLVLCACFMGMANSVREIVKEQAIYRRERAIGLSLTAYLGSKVVVLTLITAPQAVVFTLIGVLGRTPHQYSSSLFEILAAIAITAVTSAMVGLLISALVDNADKTMPLLVLITMGQLVFSGGLFAIAGAPVVAQLSWLIPARWGFAALASAINFNTLSRFGDPTFKTGTADALWNYGASTYWFDLAMAVILGVAAIMVCAYLLRRGDPKPGRARNDARG
jgi:ABC-type multidrug transport system ATPase subunit/pSer/pThr/pTyr-binding forkhead associated (FHA) protein